MCGSWSRECNFVMVILDKFMAKGRTQHAIGLLQLAITWYKIRHAGRQAHYYSRIGTLKQRDLNQ